MLAFPQLQTGATAQYPLVRTDVLRTTVNELADGGLIKFADESGKLTRWELRLEGLSDEEWLAISDLYSAVEGRLRTFTLLDPLSNLFAWSEDLSKDAWVKDPLLSITPGISDPFGGTAAAQLVNSGGAAQGLRQILNAPADYQYCCSAWVRSASATTIGIRRGGIVSQHPVGPTWTRVRSAGAEVTMGDTFTAGFVLNPGVTVELCAPQLEAQTSCGAYWRTTARSGVYEKVRFVDDRLDLIARDRGSNAGVLRLVSVE
ncbi:hypothetical protein F183_A43920 [Bryobacterales bacterium F-183]|nr:hypothetical protein F183_A43920 [Bryobacterales bacterium F-183]